MSTSLPVAFTTVNTPPNVELSNALIPVTDIKDAFVKRMIGLAGDVITAEAPLIELSSDSSLI